MKSSKRYAGLIAAFAALSGCMNNPGDAEVSRQSGAASQAAWPIEAEVDKAVGRMGFVREDELAALRRHVQRLESEVHELKSAAASAPAADAGAAAAVVPAESRAESPAETAADGDAPIVKPKKKKVIVEPEAGA